MSDYISLEVDSTLCFSECRKCIEECKENVLEKDEKGILKVVQPENCTACGRCIEICPVGAIWLE